MVLICSNTLFLHPHRHGSTANETFSSSIWEGWGWPVDDLPTICKLAPSPPLQHYHHCHLGKALPSITHTQTHTCAFWDCAIESQAKAEAPRQRWRAGDGTQLQGASATRHHFCLCVFLLGGPSCYHQGKAFCFHTALREGKIIKSDATITDTHAHTQKQSQKRLSCDCRLTLNALQRI